MEYIMEYSDIRHQLAELDTEVVVSLYNKIKLT